MSAAPRGSRTHLKQQNPKSESIALKTSLLTTSTIEPSKDSKPETMDTNTPEPSMQLLAEAAQNDSRELENGVTANREREERSSSLSDIDDRPVTEATDQNVEQSSQVSEEEDTEAETERLEESPQKDRKQKKVLLSAKHPSGTADAEPDNDLEAEEIVQADEDEAEADGTGPQDNIKRNGAQEEAKIIAHSARSSSLGESMNGSVSASPDSTGSKKRKRSSDDDETATSLKKVALELAHHVADQIEKDEEASSPVRIAPATNDAGEEDGEPSEEESAAEENGEDDNANEADVDNADALDSAGEDVDMEDAGHEDAGLSIRSEEELKKKKAALDMLSKIENNFAVLRDKLFADKNSQLAMELATIQSDNVTHPEYLAMVEAIDNQRKERIEQATTLFEYKLLALRTKCVANRAQLHSQYFQTVRELRESALENASREWYQIQRERRSIDEAKSQALNHFVDNRPQLVAQQTAYNAEVSILSGVAKYVGFPAAPEIKGASAGEIEEDLRNMGVSLQTVTAPVVNRFLPQKQPREEQQFLEQNPWANAQHPYHSQLANHAAHQVPDNLRSTSPFTPVNQKRVGEAIQNGSASTIPALPSSSVAPTPMSAEPGPLNMPQSRSGLGTEVSYTPSRPSDHDATNRPRSITPNRDEISTETTSIAEMPRSSNGPGFPQRIMGNGDEVNSAPKSSPPRQPAHPLSETVSPDDDRMQPGFTQHANLPARVEVGNA